MNLEAIDDALKVNLAFKIKNLLEMQKNSKLSKKDFLNIHYGQFMTAIAYAHIKYVTFWFFKDKISNGDIKCLGVKSNLTNLCVLYGLHLLN